MFDGRKVIKKNCYHYIFSLCNKQKHLPKIQTYSTMENMVSYLEKSNHDFMVLLQDPVQRQTWPQKSRLNLLNDLFKAEKAVINDFVVKSWYAANCNDLQNIMMGFARVLPCEQCLFEMFTKVLMVDCISDTNKESRPLLTMNGKHGNGKCLQYWEHSCQMNKQGYFIGRLVVLCQICWV